MYAIVEIAGQQYKVKKDQQLFVHRLEGKEGSKVAFDQVLLTADGDKIEVGAPAVKGVSVSAKILEHLKGDKVVVFKKKRRKGYAVKNGHRQQFSKIEIDGIGTSKAAPKAAAKKEEVKAKTEKAETKKVESKKAEPKKAAAKPTTKASTTEKSSKKTEAVKPKPTAKPKEAKPKASAKSKTSGEGKAEKSKKEVNK